MIQFLTLISSLILGFPLSFGRVDSTLIDSARKMNNIGIEYLWGGDYGKAEQYFQKSLQLKKEIYLNTPHIPIATSYNNIGILKIEQWQYDSALFYLSKSEEIYGNFPNQEVSLAILNSNRGSIYNATGDYQRAEQLYTRALQILTPIDGVSAGLRRAETYNRLGLLYVEQKEFAKAEAFYLKGIREPLPKNEKLVLQYLYSNLASVYLKTEQYDLANTFYRKAISVIRNSNDLGKTLEAKVLQKQALLYSETTNKKRAFTSIHEAKSIYESTSVDSTYYQALYFDMAILHENFFDFDSALFYYQKALYLSTNEHFTDIFQSPDSKSFGNIYRAISQLKAKAECFIKWNKKETSVNKINSAIEALETASILIDLSRNSYLSLESKLIISENENPIYRMGLFCASELYKLTKDDLYLEKAFYFAEKSKSSVLASELQESKARQFGNIPQSLLEEENSLKREISFYSEKLYDESLRLNPDSFKISTWNKYLFEFSKQQEILRHTLESKYPDYYALKYKQTAPILSDIQKIIGANTSIIEYTLSDSILYIFQINKNKATLTEVIADSAFLNTTYKYLNYYRNFSFLHQNGNTYAEIHHLGSAMYMYLIAPLKTDDLRSNVIIVPDDLLAYLPFETIVKPGMNNPINSYADLDFLIKHHALSYSYSAALLHDTWAGTKRKIRNKLLAVAPEYKPASSENIVQRRLNYRPYFRNNLTPIPFAMEEAQGISELTKGKSLVGKNATEQAFREQSGKFDILHLAMHTVIDDSNPLFSKLIFFNENYSSEQGQLTTNEIFGLNLKAQMTVLSSCSSGEGELRKGEGVLSLARGFFYAGCPSLVMTLWQVEDKSGLILMENYYKYLLKGYTKPVALQKAKIKYINTVPDEKKAPFYWSAYITIGNPAPIYVSRILLYSIPGIILFFGMVFFFRWKSNKKPTLKEPKP